MSNTVTASEQYFVIKIDGKNSGQSPRGQKDAFPIRYIEFPDLGTKVNLSDDSTYTNPRYPLFSVFDLGGDGDNASASQIEALNNLLEDMRQQQDPVKVTLIRVVNQSKEGKLNMKEYEADRTIELDKATIHLASGSNNLYQVQAEKAVMGTGDKASKKVPIDYINKT